MFDSDVLILCLRGDPIAGRVVNSEPQRTISMVSLIELLQGSKSSAQLKTARDFVRKLEMRLLPVTEAISFQAVALIKKHSAADGFHLGDALIAATAIENDETLFTGNVRHFHVVHALKIKPFRHAGVH